MASPNLALAMALARAGLRVLPCEPLTKAALLRNWPERATNDTGKLAELWHCYRNAVPGIALGLCGLFAVDLDVKNGVDGVAAFDELLDRHGELPLCPFTRTPTGGYHAIFRQPCHRKPLGNRRGSLPRGIDIRGAGGMIIAPGSLRPDGQFYESVPGWPELIEAFATGTIPQVPEWLIRIIEGGDSDRAIQNWPTDSTPGRSCNKSAWVAAGLEAEARALAATSEGGRNNLLWDIVHLFAGHAANGWTTRQEVYAAVRWACTLNGYLSSTAPNDGPKCFEKTFESGWRIGFTKPTRGPRADTVDPAFAAMCAKLKPRAAR